MSDEHELTSFTLELFRRSLRDEVFGSKNPVPEHATSSWNFLLANLDRKIDLWLSNSRSRPNSEQLADSEAIRRRKRAYARTVELLKALKQVDRGSTLRTIMAHPIEHESPAVDDQRVTDFAFHVIGWFTGFWDARSSAEVSHPVLRIDDSGRHTRSSRFWSNASCLREFEDASVSMEDARDMPLTALAGSAFGHLLPRPSRFGSGDVEACVSSATVATTHLSWEKSGFKIIWTATLAQHLEIDEKNCEIAVYKYPSIMLLTLCMGKASPLARILAADEDDDERLQAASRMRMANTDVRRSRAFVGFCEEMIRSYLLLFGARAWFSACIRPRQDRLLMSLPPNPDPLLVELMKCRKDVQESHLLKKVIGWPAINEQVILAQYPYLRVKLAEVARIGRGFKMPRPWHVYHDRHNPNGWTVFWLLGMLGLFALLMQFLQLAAQIKSID